VNRKLWTIALLGAEARESQHALIRKDYPRHTTGAVRHAFRAGALWALRYLRRDRRKLLRLLAEAKNMAEFGDINADMEDDGVGWKQWYIEAREVLRENARGG
jgi:hypothetical protein